MDTKLLTRLVKDHAVEFIDLKFSDLPGLWHHLTLPIASLDDSLFSNGVGVDGSSLPGFSSVEQGDMIMLPDPQSAFIDPFYERPTVSMIGDIFEVGNGMRPFSRNPRRVTYDAEKYILQVVPQAQAILGPEFEFYIFDRVSFHQGASHAFYSLESDEGIDDGSDNEEGLGYKIPYKKGYHAAPPWDRTYNLRSEIAAMLADVGVGLKYHHHEVGGAGQLEIEVSFASMGRMADLSMLIKYIIKNQCFRRGKSATFMPKPLFNEPGSGLHVHQFLSGPEGSLFYDPNGPAQFSELGRWYIGGLLKHVDSILAFTNPSTNSFKRLVPGFEAPVSGAYSVGNRTACIRIPGYQRNPKTVRFEFRPPDGTMNPYLGYAAMIMAGLDGIKNKIDPGLPRNENFETLPPAELAKLHRLPTSLTKALDALERDHDYLLQGGVFTEDLLKAWVNLKRTEVDEIRVRPTPHEFEMYYDI